MSSEEASTPGPSELQRLETALHALLRSFDELSGRAASSRSRSSDSARCAPRRVPITAWISSTITVRTVRSICRLRSEVSSR